MDLLARLRRTLANGLQGDDGVIGLAFAAALVVAGMGALSVFLSLNQGQRALDRAQSVSAGQSTAVPAILAYYIQNLAASGAVGAIPCPDRTSPPDGTAEASCASSSTNAGVIPWVTLGLTRDQARDGNGNYYTYVVSPTATGQAVCNVVTNSYSSSQQENTGTLAATGLSVATYNPTANATVASGSETPFAVIGHGNNKLGALVPNDSAGTTYTTTAATSAGELANCHPGACTTTTWTTIVTGPSAGSTGNTAFDDQVSVPDTEQLKSICAALTPGGAVNAFVSESFDDGATLAANSRVDTTGTATKILDPSTMRNPQQNNYVVSLSTAGAGLITKQATSSTPTRNLDPSARSIYVSGIWTADVNNVGFSGMSIVTRATLSQRFGSTDLFDDDGITFRFYEAGVGNGANTNISIERRNAGANVQVQNSASTYTLTAGSRYLIEAYDDGTTLWARITEVGNTSNTATVTDTSLNSGDANVVTGLDGDNRVAFISEYTNGTSVNYIDTLLVAKGAQALELNGSSGFVQTGSSANVNHTTGSITLEAWIRPHTRPAAGAAAIVMAKWDAAVANNANAYRLYIDSNGVVRLGVADNTATVNSPTIFNTGIIPELNTWSHVAIAFTGSTGSVSAYLNGELAATGTLAVTTGMNASSSRFTVGAEYNGASVQSYFDGNISDVRVWNTVRSATEIAANYQSRLAYTGTPTGLVVNWKLDYDTLTAATDPIFASTVARVSPAGLGTNGDLQSGASYVAISAIHLRPFSTTFCPSGTIINAYQCDIRAASGTPSTGVSTSFTVPSNLNAIYAKVWGGGGGGFTGNGSSTGGPAGFGAGRIQTVGGTTVAGLMFDVAAGGGGLGNSGGDPNYGSGGGGASGLRRVSSSAALVAGGGGGAAYSNENDADLNCDDVVGTNSQCGLGGGGGGPGSTASSLWAPDNTGAARCGGRGGLDTFATPPEGNRPGDSSECNQDGTNPVGTAGGTGGGGSAGGASTLGAGGTGGDGGNGSGGDRVGGGGGGGGVSNAGLTLGGGEQGGARNQATSAYGGGGGAGYADSGVLSSRGTSGTPRFTTTPVAPNNTDADYAPSYVTGATTPGQGGSSSGGNGSAGAVILKW